MKIALSLLFLAAGIRAIEHEKKITRPNGFLSVLGAAFDANNYNASLVKYVTPMPIKTMVEMLRLHSEPIFKSFTSNYESHVRGSRVMIGSSYEKRAQADYNVVLQDYLPMNEADAAAARYLFSVTNCSIKRNESTMPKNVTGCQYYGAKILSDIVRRLTPIHSLLTMGSLQLSPMSIPLAGTGTTPKVPNTPPELIQQITKIVAVLGGTDIASYLNIVDPGVSTIWGDICNRVRNGGYILKAT